MGRKPTKKVKFVPLIIHPLVRSLKTMDTKIMVARIKKCEKLYLKVCKIFMKYKSCKFNQNCKFFNPKKLKNDPKKPETKYSQQQNEENLSYAKIVARILHPKNALLGHQNFMGHPQAMQVISKSFKMTW